MSQDNSLKLSVVIPAHNEQENIAGSLRSLWGRLDDAAIDYELVVVNDNSTDETGRVISELEAENERIRRVDREPPRGFGRAIRSGLDAARGDVVVIYMADASDDPGDVVMYYDKICLGYDCVFGSRFIRGSSTSNYPRIKLLVNRLVNTMLRVLFWTRFNDLTNSFKAYRAHVLRECGPYRASHFNITIELSLSAITRNYNIMQVPISWQGRTWGSSKLHLKEMGRRYLSTLIKVYFEKILIHDDLMEETLAHRFKAHTPPRSLELRLEQMEKRLAALEKIRD